MTPVVGDIENAGKLAESSDGGVNERGRTDQKIRESVHQKDKYVLPPYIIDLPGHRFTILLEA